MSPDWREQHLFNIIYIMRSYFTARLREIHSVQLVLILCGFFLIGWFGGFLVNGGGKWLADAFRLAYLNQYQVRAGLTTGGKSYYVSTSNTPEMIRVLEADPGVVSIQPTFIDDLLIIVISRDYPETYSRLQGSRLVNVITTLPLLCH